MSLNVRSAAALGWAVPLLLAAAPVQDLPANGQAENVVAAEPEPVTEPVPVIVNEAPEPEPEPEPVPAPAREPIVESNEQVVENAAEPEAPVPVATPVPSGPPLVNTSSAAANSPAPTVEERGTSWVWVLVALGALAAVFGAGKLLRRRAPVRAVPRQVPASSPAPEPVAAEPRATVEVSFRTVRAGLNLLSATAEGVFVIANRGDRPATGIRFGALLLPGHAQLDGELADLWVGGVTRPVVPPFALAPGEEREVHHTLTLPRGAIEPLMTGGRPMFVPVVAISAVYDRGNGEEGQAGRAWVLGIARPGSDRLAPLWLDETPRNRDDMAARPHTARVDR